MFKRGIIDREKNYGYKKIIFKTIRAAKRKYFHNYFDLDMNRLMGKRNVRPTVKSIILYVDRGGARA